jgi:glycosyltransferase involved in cell wall biosynthesis
MKVLLIGEYSNVFNTLAEGLRKIGICTTVASAGDSWKDYPRDIDLNKGSNLNLLWFLTRNFKKLTGYDAVQVINPLYMFSGSAKTESLNKYLFTLLKMFNEKIFLSALGDDYFWLKKCMSDGFRYSPFDSKKKISENSSHFSNSLKYLKPHNQKLNYFLAGECDGIIAGLFEYYSSYHATDFRSKLSFIPLPVNTDKIRFTPKKSGGKLEFFMGIQKNRSLWKGTDILLKVFTSYAAKYPNDIHLKVVESMAYSQYIDALKDSDFLIDQLYSYSPAMNGLTAMAMGIILMGGGEPEIYELLGEKDNKPIINLTPDTRQIGSQIEQILDNKGNLENLKYRSRQFVERHHNYISVASGYASHYRT